MKKIAVLVILLLITQSVFADDFHNVKYLKNYDGDTITFDLGPTLPDVFRYIRIRLQGIDTPEIKSKEVSAFAAKNFVYDELKNASKIDLIDCKRDKYFRLDCYVIYDNKNLTEELLQHGYGYKYYGGKKKNLD